MAFLEKAEGEEEGAARDGQGYEGAGPFVAVAWTGGDAWRVEKEEPEQEHEAQAH